MNKTLVIAEAGVNHNGDLNLAKRLVDEAKNAGADIVKFQTFDPNQLASKKAEMAEYQKDNLGTDDSQLSMLRKLALGNDAFNELSDYCKKIGIKFLSTPFDIQSIAFLNALQDTWKIPSGEITNYPYLVEIAKTHKSVILSTGMSSLDEIESALNVLKENGACDISILHCNTQYPTPYSDVNLRAMYTLKNKFGLKVGYSDHTQGIEVPIAAVPRTLFHFIGLIPDPGLLVVRLNSEKTSPFFISVFATILFLATDKLARSDSVTRFSPSPRAFSIFLIARTISASSLGSKLAL